MRPLETTSHHDLLLSIAVGKGTGATIHNETIAWGALVEKLRMAPVDPISIDEYQALSKEERTRRKAKRGYFILAEFDGDRRNNGAVRYRTGAQIDIEGSDASIDAILKCVPNRECLVHSTRSSLAGDRRYRLLIPYAHPVDVGAHQTATRNIIYRLKMTGVSCDERASLTPSQPAFLPTTSDGQDYLFRRQAGELLAPADNAAPPPEPSAPLEHRELADLPPRSNLDDAQKRSLLEHLATLPEYADAHNYHSWVAVGHALKWDDDSADGFALFHYFSERVAGYDGWDATLRKWDQLRLVPSSNRPVTMASLIKAAKDTGWTMPPDQVTQEAAVEVGKTIKMGALEIPPIEEIPRREWLLGHRVLRGYVNVEMAPGGVGKSVFSLVSALALVTGQELTGERVHQQGKVMMINWEDDKLEIARRLHGACQAFKLDMAALGLGDRLLLQSLYGKEGLLVASGQPTAAMEAIIGICQRQNVLNVVIDPFVATHDANENDNIEMNKVMMCFRRLAAEANVGVTLIHHSAKGSGKNSEAHAASGDAGRGASAIRDAARVTSTLARMSTETAEDRGISDDNRVRLFRHDIAKSNFGLPDAEANWFRLESVALLNGDEVGVPRPYELPETTAAGGVDDEDIRLERITYLCNSMAADREPRNSLIDRCVNRLHGTNQEVSKSTFQRTLDHLEADKHIVVSGQAPGVEWRFWWSREGRIIYANRRQIGTDA